MAKPSRFVHIVDDVPELEALRAEADGPVLLHALSGFLDAGSATRIAVDHLVEADPGRVVASFDIDAFYDYRARRPLMTFHESAYRDYDAPRLVVRLCHDQREHPYLLMHGPEPDTHWEAFATGVRAVIERLDVSLVMGMGAVPMAVPHTRPIMLTNHATDPDLLTVENMWKGEIRIPASAASMLELRLGEWGHDAMGFVAHVPHYVANLDYPEASLRLLESVTAVTGLSWELAPLQAQATSAAALIAGQMADSDEVRDVVAGLEQQYDAFHTGDETLPLAEERELPTAEELGAEFERFLAGLDTPEEQ
ncbi:MAG: PAC2 family protein [Nocardioidaceae bacterium]|nr:MAG: PAC2 family protein [Nocardioidaceae bacterium]